MSETRMATEAAEAPAVIDRLLREQRGALERIGADLRANPPRAILTVARGSSDHAATYLKHIVEARGGVLVASFSPSTASVYGSAPDAAGMLAVALSQSGASPDLLASMAAARSAGARTLALVNVADSPLAQSADSMVALGAGPERSVAATKSFLAMLAASAALVAHWTEDGELLSALDGITGALARAWDADWSPLVAGLADVRGLYVIGRGPGFGAAQEMALKLKETCQLQAEAFSAAEVRHGPMALVGQDLPLLVLRQDDEAAAGTDELVRDALAKGARVFVASAGSPPEGAVHLPIPATHPTLAPLAGVQAFYRAANALSLARGLDPDRPPHLRKVTETV